MSSATEAAATAVATILTEDVLTLAEAREVILEITGRRPDKTTIFRWCFRGVGPKNAKIKLAHVRLGDRIYTSTQEIHRFIESRTAQSYGGQPHG